ncbi:AcrB/AcrD/AcrF family protein [Rhodohalobacter sp. SW132]|uniref:efflux RND transporter permease subunit n=1 Tax=Rhodohalobacter sp. SW132 TaxID=2293433 RepID=UPI000E243FC4|nr:efflux RND transporter permease subunit [Rhodohalobacter sp. SW132]REL32914.1 AcrB/AcrD/AcrF family protein [Rhodohalobacter sp. SW132]
MQLPEFSIKNYRFILILVVMAFVVGLFALFTMPRTEDPDMALPFYTISVVYPGTSPEDMQELVVKPIEDALDEIDDLTEILTTIEEGLAVFEVEAGFGIDRIRKLDEITREVNGIRNQLPDGIFSLDIEQFRPEALTNIIQFALVSETASYRELNATAEMLEHRLKRIDGVRNVDIEANPEEEIRVAADFQRMAAQNVSLDMILHALTDQNMNIPGGNLNIGSGTFGIQTSGSLKSLDEIRQIPVASGASHVVYLDDIADVFYAHEDIRWIARFMDQRTVYINIKRESSKNLIQITNSIFGQLEELQAAIPSDMSLEVVFEQASAVEGRINDFFLNLLQGIVLVAVIIFLFLGFRSALITGAVIPIAMIAGIGVLNFIGYGLQQISIAALVIALGLLVDNGIVVVENIVRFRKKGHTLIDAAVKGTSEVGYAIISATLTTVLVFAPLAMMQSGPGEFLRSLPVTVIIVLILSLILALTFIPLLATRLMSDSPEAKESWVDRFIRHLISRYYRPALDIALKYKGFVFSSAVILFLGSLMLFPYIGVSFFPTADKPVLLIEVDLPHGTNVEETDRAVRFVEGVLDETEFVKNYTSNIGHGNPQIYYNRFPESFKSNHGQILVNFEEWDQERFYSTLRNFRESFARYPGARISFSELTNGPPFYAPVEIRILGERLDILKDLSLKVEDLIRNTGGTIDVNNPMALNRTNINVDINREKASLAGLSIASADRTIRAAMSGFPADKAIMSDGKEYPIMVRLALDEQTAVSDFDKIYLTNQYGEQIPLNQVADIRFGSATNSFIHYNLQRGTTVSSNVTNQDRVAAITEEIIAGLNEIDWPDGYSYYVAGEYASQHETFGDMTILVFVALFGIFAVLVLQFRSFLQPLIIFSAIPMAITGSFLALFITGWSFSFFAFVGFVSLIGIVVNNSIILVDYANQLLRDGKSVLESITEAAETRFTPIILTTTTTIAGLLPLTLSGTSLWSPLGWTIIGGMITSTALTLLIVPVLFLWFTTEERIVAGD